MISTRKNPKNVIIGHLNVNSVRNKIVAVKGLIKTKTDICLILKTKVDELNGYKMFQRDRDRFGGGLMLYVNEQIPSKVFSLKSIPMDTELILLQFTVKNRRWLCIYKYIWHI